MSQISTLTAVQAAAVRTPKGKTQRAAAPATRAIGYAIAQGVRPGAGAALKAHTAAFLVASDMAFGGAFPKAKAVQVIGATAVAYHLKQANFMHTDKGLILSEKGHAYFTGCRAVDPELATAYEEFFYTGNFEKVGIKNAAFISKV